LLLHFFSKHSNDAFWIGSKTICTDQQTLDYLATGANLLEKSIDEVMISLLALDVALLDKRRMHSLALYSCPLLPGCHRSFVKSKRMHDRLQRTPIAKQGTT
jgi:hypothetical protein